MFFRPPLSGRQFYDPLQGAEPQGLRQEVRLQVPPPKGGQEDFQALPLPAEFQEGRRRIQGPAPPVQEGEETRPGRPEILLPGEFPLGDDPPAHRI